MHRLASALILLQVPNLSPNYALAESFVSGGSDLNYVSDEWRKLQSKYESDIRALQEKRAAEGEKAKGIQDKLDALRSIDVSAQAEADMREGLDGMAESIPEAAIDYFKGIGKPNTVLEVGAKIITETLPAFKKAYEAQFAEVDMEFEIDQLESELTGYENSIKKFDGEIKDLEVNAELSKKVAEAYEAQLVAELNAGMQAGSKVQNAVEFTLTEAKKKVDEITIPDGWVACSCPSDHAHLGKLIKGVRYHEGGQTCPQP